MTNLNWLAEYDIPAAGGQPDMGAGGPPQMQPGVPGDPMGGPFDKSASKQQNQPGPPQQKLPDLSQDPATPDMPEAGEDEDDFEVWKIKFIEQSIKGDQKQLIDMINEIRDRQLEAGPRRFVEDNLNVNLLRMDANIGQAAVEIRKNIKKGLDRTHPAVSVVEHIYNVLLQDPKLSQLFIKCSGLNPGNRQDEYRKLIAAFIGGVQVGNGGSTEDVIFEEQDYTIRISTRFNSKWGDVSLGRWYPNEDDAERYLKGPELDRLKGGSPGERNELRKRVVIESIAELFRERAFIVTVVEDDGTISNLAWDLGSSLKPAYNAGKIIVKMKNSDVKEAFIDDNGTVVPIPNVSVYYVKETGELDEMGDVETEEIEFIQHRSGLLYLTANLDIMKEAVVSLEGMSLKDIPYSGNNTDLFKIQRCVPSSNDTLLRQCI